MGHSFPRLRSYITCHFPFTDMLSILRMGNAIIFLARSNARDKVTYFKPHAVFHICFPYQHKVSFQRVTLFLSDSTFSHWAKSKCRLSLAHCLSGSLVSGEDRLKQTQLKSLSINVVALALFYPKAKTFRPVHSSVFECLYSCSAVVLFFRTKDIKQIVHFINSV